MNLHQILFDLSPAIMAIYKLGFIPDEDEIHEFTAELYDAFESQGGDISKRLYTIIPKDEKNRLPEKEIRVLTEDEIPRLWRGSKFLRGYAKEIGCDSEESDEILAAAAAALPPVFSENSRF
jgi:hypothetical protein